MESSTEFDFVIEEVLKIRQQHRRMGGRKLYEKMKDYFLEHAIKMGRDALFDLLSSNNLLVKKRKRYTLTTNSKHWMRKYPNLIKDYTPTKPNEIWVSDITYWKIKSKYLYISFITDMYSRKIIGYHVAETLEAIQTIKALEMALKTLQSIPENLTHHSDRGLQYCSSRYVKLLNKYKIKISMTQNGDPLENAIAERINGIIKSEYLFDLTIGSITEAKKILNKVVELYNEQRPHLSINYMTPMQAHELSNEKEIKRLWKNYYTKKQSLEVVV